jgi:hypothetical protein
MNRRNFLATILSTVSFGTVSLSKAQSSVATQSTTVDITYSMYEELVDLHNKLKLNNCSKQERYNILTPKFDKLLQYMLYNFGDLPCKVNDIPFYISFERRFLLTPNSAEDLKKVTPGAIPVLIAKEVLYTCRMNVMVAKLAYWRPYCEKYHDLIRDLYYKE